MVVLFWHICFSPGCAENEDFCISARLMLSSGGQLNSFLGGVRGCKHKQTVCEESPPALVHAFSLQWSAVKDCVFFTLLQSVCCTQVLVTCSGATCVQSFINSIFINAKPIMVTTSDFRWSWPVYLFLINSQTNETEHRCYWSLHVSSQNNRFALAGA